LSPELKQTVKALLTASSLLLLARIRHYRYEPIAKLGVVWLCPDIFQRALM
jgi:hypothetical protein